MAKLIKFPLAMADGTKARSIEELREHSDVASIATYFEDGRLQRWLLANYLDDEAKKVEEIKEFFDSENKKLKVQNIHKLYESLELGKVDEKQISVYLENQQEVKTNIVSFEVEDDSSVREELKKHIYPGTNLENWLVSFEEVDDNNQYVKLLNKKTDLYGSYKIKKDNNIYSRIAFLIYQMEKSENSNLDRIMNLNKKIAEESEIQFGKYNWNVLRVEGNQAYLLCSQIVNKMSWKYIGTEYSLLLQWDSNFNSTNIREWLNTDFIDNSFSDEELSLIEDKGTNKVFLPSSKDLELLSAKSRRRSLEGEKLETYWCSDCTIVDKNGGIQSNCDRHALYGVVPAIIVKIGI